MLARARKKTLAPKLKWVALARKRRSPPKSQLPQTNPPKVTPKRLLLSVRPATLTEVVLAKASTKEMSNS